MTIHVYQLSNVSYSNSSCSKKNKAFPDKYPFGFFFQFGVMILEYCRALDKIPINLSKITTKTTF